MSDLIEGIPIQVNGDVQEAIDEAGRRYRAKFGQVPTHVSLPGWAAPDALNLYTLRLAHPTSAGKMRTRHMGTVIVGRVRDA